MVFAYLCGANHIHVRMRAEYGEPDYPLLTHNYFSFMKLSGILFLVVPLLGSAYCDKACGGLRNGRAQWRFAINGLGIWGGKFRIGTQSECLAVALTSTTSVNCCQHE